MHTRALPRASARTGPKRASPTTTTTLAPAAVDPSTIDLEDLKERMLFIEALEAVKCYDEGVLTSVPQPALWNHRRAA